MTVNRTLPWLFVLAVVVAVGCTKKDGGGSNTGPTSTPPTTESSPTESPSKSKTGMGLTATPYQVKEVANPGQLEVSVTYASSPIPKPAEVPVNTNVEHCGGKVFTEEVLVDEATRGLKNVVVRLEGIAAGPRKPPEKVVVTNKHCAFVPHVSVAVKGGKLEIHNDDPVQHTTHPYVNGRHFFNTVLSAGSEPKTRTLRQSGLMEINCDVHKWMRGYMVIHTNPYLSVTDAMGKLSIDEIPPGQYPYVAWHEKLGEQRGTVNIEAGSTASLKLEFALPQ